MNVPVNPNQATLDAVEKFAREHPELVNEQESVAQVREEQAQPNGAGADDLTPAPALLPSASKAVDFLLSRPGFPVLSFAEILEPDGKKGLFETQSFPSRIREKLEAWIEARDGRGNIYFSINTAIKPQNKKLEREQIKDFVSLHIDLDPWIDEPQEKAQARLIKKLQSLPKPPTWIIVSGGGVWGIWDLVEGVPINGDLEIAEDLKMYNVHWERELGGDNCHNIDRISRCPYTTNVPDERKRKKKRERAVAYVHTHNETNYTIADFVKAAPLKAADAPRTDLIVPASTRIARRKRAKEIDTDNAKHVSFDDLTALNLSPLALNIIQHGDDHLKLNKELEECGLHQRYDDRSKPLWALVNEMTRAKIGGDTIFSVITDQAYGVSASVREKKRSWKRYAKKQITDAEAELAAEEMAARTGIAEWPDGHDQFGKINAFYGNTLVALDSFAFDIRKDVFRDKTFIGPHELADLVGSITDDSTIVIQHAVYGRCGFYPQTKHIEAAVTVRALEHKFDPVLDRLNGLKWDEVPRLDTWLIKFMGAVDTPYTRQVARKVLIGLARRIRNPGCKVDSTMVLEGLQELGKSRACKDLASFFAPDLFSDAALLTLDGKEQQELLTGVLVVELSELEGLGRADLEKIKAFLTRTSDRGRPAYGRVVRDRARRCIFIATTNKKNYLTDQSGNRRWWPVEVTKYDRDGDTGFIANLEQLLAEAAHYEAQGEPLYLSDDVKAAAKLEQTARMVEDGWPDLLNDLYGVVHDDGGDQEERVASKWVLEHKLKLLPDRHLPAALSRLGPAMRANGWAGPTQMRIKEQGKCMGYSRKARPEAADRWAAVMLEIAQEAAIRAKKPLTDEEVSQIARLL